MRDNDFLEEQILAFQNKWYDQFSIIYLRYSLEFSLNQAETISGIERNDFNRRNKETFSKRLEEVYKKNKKDFSVLKREAFQKIQVPLKECWTWTSKLLHYNNEKKRNISKEEYRMRGSNAFESCYKLIKLISNEDYYNIQVNLKLEDYNAQESVQEINVEEFWNKINDLKNELNVANEQLKVKDKELNNKEMNKTIMQSINESNEKFKLEIINLKDELSNIENKKDDELLLQAKHFKLKINQLQNAISLIKTETNPSYKIVNLMKRNINAQSFKTFIFGESKYHKFQDAIDYIFGNYNPVSEDVIQTWNKYQEVIDFISYKINWEEFEVNDEDIFGPPKDISANIGIDSYIRFIEDYNVHVTFKFVKDEDWKILSMNNFVSSNKYINYDLDWRLFTSWSRGVQNLAIVYVNKETNDFKVTKQYKLSDFDTKMNNYSLILKNKINELGGVN